MNYRIRNIPKFEYEQHVHRGIQSLSNVDLLTDLICQRHQLLAKQRPNAKSQAEEIRSCLDQALEYREAAKSSEYARPTLIYYSLMSFALCEILLKRDGNYRLRKLREQHGHHGLDFSIADNGTYRSISPSDLRARPVDRGTFGVWHKTSQQAPIWGKRTIRKGQAQTSGIEILAWFDNAPQDSLESVSLAQLAEICPALYIESAHLKIRPKLVRATIENVQDHNSETSTWSLTIHPGPKEQVDATLKQITFHPRCVDSVQVREFSSGGGFSITAPLESDHLEFMVPSTFSQDGEIALIRSDTIELNEFGIYYLSSYIAGMFTRYYPEVWKKCSNDRNNLYLVIDAMMSAAIIRAPMLLLEEFRREILVLT